jgi:hypothetical protein
MHFVISRVNSAVFMTVASLVDVTPSDCDSVIVVVAIIIRYHESTRHTRHARSACINYQARRRSRK